MYTIHIYLNSEKNSGIIKLMFSVCSYGSVVEHCVNNAQGCGFNSQVTHVLTKNV